ncbi:hypothetical protein LCGC14_0673460 [marine sediment metagenome]|uniref:Uncharacterized protein n=1 Tax=marine sediment metagenome TaxID=412755 RepID=A0A0F9QQC5_9ZZZZ
MKAAGKVVLSVLGWLVFLALSPLLAFLFVLACGVVAAWYCIVTCQVERAIERAHKASEQSLAEIDRYLAETKQGKYDQQILSDPATLRRVRSRLAPGSKVVN